MTSDNTLIPLGDTVLYGDMVYLVTAVTNPGRERHYFLNHGCDVVLLPASIVESLPRNPKVELS